MHLEYTTNFVILQLTWVLEDLQQQAMRIRNGTYPSSNLDDIYNRVQGEDFFCEKDKIFIYLYILETILSFNPKFQQKPHNEKNITLDFFHYT